MPPALPTIKLLKGRDARLKHGSPWVYSNEIDMTAEAKSLAPGSLVSLRLANGESAGTAYFNHKSLIAARLLTPRGDATIDAAFFKERVSRALSWREKLFDQPFYRLVHAEGDALPGLIIDRYGDVVVVQAGTAGMERLLPEIQSALLDLLKPKGIVLRNDSGSRQLEGLESYIRVAEGEVPEHVEILENGSRFLVNPQQGQKTGWFFDQRNNRRDIAAIARDARVLDAYSHTGGFAIAALVAGAKEAIAIDSSADALAMAEQSANLNDVGRKATWRRGDVFDELPTLASQNEAFDVVVCDPPAFVKSRKDLESGARGYRKLARLGSSLVTPGGFLFIASCSHNIDAARFEAEVTAGIGQAGRTGRIIAQAGAGPDHPINPLLPETAYLKSVLLNLD
jgi:23S rRNA (cytosine1962-C5)-methyltransferase